MILGHDLYLVSCELIASIAIKAVATTPGLFDFCVVINEFSNPVKSTEKLRDFLG
jgi:hypothetical protein